MMLIEGLGKGLIVHSFNLWSAKVSLLAAGTAIRAPKLFLFLAALYLTFWDRGVEIRSVVM